MYLEYYQLRESPFPVTPNGRYFFPAKSHDEALSILKFAISERKGFSLLTGEVGTGKTTTVRALLRALPDDVHTALVINPLVSVPELLDAIMEDFGVWWGKVGSVQDKISRLNSYLLRLFKKGHNAVVIIDEAQSLSFEALEMVRMLSNLETESAKLLQIILVGQPELEKSLRRLRLRQLRQRIQMYHRLQPFDRLQVSDYVAHCLKIASESGSELVHFEKDAIRRIHNLSGGVPRLINKICDYALIAGFVRDTRIITGSVVNAGYKEFAYVFDSPGLEKTGRHTRSGRSFGRRTHSQHTCGGHTCGQQV